MDQEMEAQACSICFEPFNKSSSVKTLCNHQFHRTCIREWLYFHQSCPLCRNVIANVRPDIQPVFESFTFVIEDIDQDIRMYAPDVPRLPLYEREQDVELEYVSDDEHADPDYVMSDSDSQDESE